MFICFVVNRKSNCFRNWTWCQGASKVFINTDSSNHETSCGLRHQSYCKIREQIRGQHRTTITMPKLRHRWRVVCLSLLESCTNWCGMIKLIELNIFLSTWFISIILYFHSTNELMPHQFVQDMFVQEFVAVSSL